jgi:phosphoglycolate phosphatase
MSIKAVFFDLDGTLVDTMPDIIAALEGALKRNGFPSHPPEKYPAFVGHGLRNAGLQALPPEAREDGAMVDKMYGDILDLYRAEPAGRTRMYDGIGEVLESLHTRGYRLVIVTNKDLEIAEVVIETCLPRALFDIITGVDNDTPPKPDPKGSLRALKALELKSEVVILIGDSDVDIATAGAAGFSSAAVSWGYRTVEQLIAAGAGRIVYGPEEIVSIVEGTE